MVYVRTVHSLTIHNYVLEAFVVSDVLLCSLFGKRIYQVRLETQVHSRFLVLEVGSLS